MARSQVNRASVFAIVAEDTAAQLKVISAASSYIPLKSGFSMKAGFEAINNEEITDDIGRTKSVVGKENPSGSHSAYLKNSQAAALPHWSLLLLSALGTKVERTTEYVPTIASTATVVVVASDTNFQVGEALFLNDLQNGYQIRNISSIVTAQEQLVVNFALPQSTGTATIRKNWMIKP